VRLSTERLELQTAFAFRIAHGPERAHVNTLVRIEHDGVVGLGEASPAHYYGESPALGEAALEAWKPVLGEDPFAIQAIEERLDRTLDGQRAARAALEMALWDWVGKRLGVPVWRLFGLDRAAAPLSCVTLGMADREEMERKLQTVIDFPILKVKLGRPEDIENLEWIRARYRGLVRVDANASWSPADAVRALRRIERLEIELVEQPVPRHDLDGLRWVRDRSGIPVFADESCHDPSDIANLAGRVDGVNLKLMKAGGLRRMRDTLVAARAHGLKVMLGSMVESSLALSAAAQLAPLADYLDLDGHWLLARDPFRGAPAERGAIILSDAPGLGVAPAEVA
jgi:L-Ala-D/L-Glu epimerase